MAKDDTNLSDELAEIFQNSVPNTITAIEDKIIEASAEPIPDDETVPVIVTPITPILKKEISELADEDFEKVRDNLKIIMDIGKESLERLSNLAINSNDPRVYRVLGELIKSVSESTRELIDLHKKKQELENEKAPKAPTINNNLILTTEELIKMIKMASKEPEKETT